MSRSLDTTDLWTFDAVDRRICSGLGVSICPGVALFKFSGISFANVGHLELCEIHRTCGSLLCVCASSWASLFSHRSAAPRSCSWHWPLQGPLATATPVHHLLTL